MDIATAKRASALGVPVVYKGVQYERITKRITNVTPGEADTYSLELLDYCGSAVVIAPMAEVEAMDDSIDSVNPHPVFAEGAKTTFPQGKA